MVFSSSLSNESFKLNFEKNFFLCSSVFVNPTVLCLGGWWYCHRCVFRSCSGSLAHRASPVLGITISHQLKSVRGASGWECVQLLPDGCSPVVLANVVVASCSLPGVASSPWPLLHNCRIWRFGYLHRGSLSTKVTKAGGTKSASFLSSADDPSTAPFVGA